jgi:hypothetical protein
VIGSGGANLPENLPIRLAEPGCTVADCNAQGHFTNAANRGWFGNDVSVNTVSVALHPLQKENT